MTWLWMAAAIGGLAQSLAGAAGALLAERIGGPAVAGLPQAALVAGSAVAAFALSALTRRAGRPRALAAGALSAAAGCAAVALAAHFASLPAVLAGTLLIGAGGTAVMLTRYAAADLAGTMTAVLTATAGGAIAGPLLLPAGGPYLLAGGGFALTALCYARVRRPRPGPAPAPAAASGPASRAGLGVLTVANLVMVGVTTLAPVHLAHTGAPPAAIGVVISAHIAGMFAPSALSARLVAAAGPARAAVLGAAAMALAGAGVAAADRPALRAGLFLLGAGWNLCLVAGSTLLVAGVPATARPRREAWGEIGMGAAAAAGGGLSGPLAAGAGYPALGWIGAAAALAVPLLLAGATLPARRAGRNAAGATQIPLR
ncbi:hypothetical protein [Dactylosporangium sp. CA-139066]|uniref:hypothetical protein n=1 Tax=Dactylosporangium sp. CA-139066 TaxID=3239930 RepID=UPI003D91DD72